MAKSRKPKVNLADRRGLFPADGCGNSWYMTLVQVPGRTGPVDLDELVDLLTERGVVGASRRDVGADVHAGRIPTPAGKWGLLVALAGQSWAYLLPSFHSYELPAEVARRAGLRAIGAGYQDTANATAFDCYEGEEALVRFESCGMGGEVVEEYGSGFGESMEQTRFSGTRLPKDWIARFRHEREVQEALAREFDAFIPYIGASGYEGVVKVYGFDRKEFKRGDYLRIDLIGFGDARLEPSAADHRLLEAITAGDVEAVRAAVADGADLHRLPGHDASPLLLALSPRRDGTSRRELAAALLELGADVHQPGQEPPVHAVLDTFFEDEAELIELLELLTAYGADVNARGLDLITRTESPLHAVARKGWLAVAKFLVSKGADPGATDALGRLPRQSAEAAAESLKGIGGDKDGKYAAMIAFLDDAAAGRADLDWHADAEEASRRERRRKREMKVALGKIGAGIKALGELSGDDPSPEAVADAITYAQPDEIHLTPSDAEWPSEAARAGTAARLAAEGFEPIGRFAIPELPRIMVEAYHHPREQLYAALYDAAGQSILDLVRYGSDGTKLTVTNNTTLPETHFAMPGERTIRLPGAPADDLLRALRDEPGPAGGVAPAPADEFVERFEAAYRREIKARKRQGRRKDGSGPPGVKAPRETL